MTTVREKKKKTQTHLDETWEDRSNSMRYAEALFVFKVKWRFAFGANEYFPSLFDPFDPEFEKRFWTCITVIFTSHFSWKSLHLWLDFRIWFTVSSSVKSFTNVYLVSIWSMNENPQTFVKIRNFVCTKPVSSKTKKKLQWKKKTNTQWKRWALESNL